jgi:hypothetical protein
MKRGGKDYWAQRGGEANRGHGQSDSPDDKLEPVNRESENYYDEQYDAQDPWDPGIEYNEWDINTDDDDDTLT